MGAQPSCQDADPSSYQSCRPSQHYQSSNGLLFCRQGLAFYTHAAVWTDAYQPWIRHHVTMRVWHCPQASLWHRAYPCRCNANTATWLADWSWLACCCLEYGQHKLRFADRRLYRHTPKRSVPKTVVSEMCTNESTMLELLAPQLPAKKQLSTYLPNWISLTKWQF